IYRNYLTPGETVLIIPPTRDDNLLWQADANMSFNNALGGVQAGRRAAFFDRRLLVDMLNDRPSGVDVGSLSIFLELHHVRAVILSPADASRWTPLMRDLRLTPRKVGGVILFS